MGARWQKRSSRTNTVHKYTSLVLCYFVTQVIVIPFILDVRFVDVPAGVTQEEVQQSFLNTSRKENV